MTTAYNFPDLDISPIDAAEITNINNPTVTDSRLEITPPTDNEEEINRNVMDNSSIDISLINFEMSLDSLNEERNEVEITANCSSDKLFNKLEEEVRLEIINTQPTDDADDADGSCMSNSLLQGVISYVDFQCCIESAKTVKSKLRRMGALVVRRISKNVTHVVFSRGGNKSTLQAVLTMEKKPFLVDPHWVHSCYFNQCRVPEESYSLYQGKYLIDTLRRLSISGKEQVETSREEESLDYIELSPEDDLQPKRKSSANLPRSNSVVSLSDSGELTFDKTLTATQLLSKIEILAKRLNKLSEKDDVEAITHGKRCWSRASEAPCSPKTKAVGTNTNSFQPKKSFPLRRRSHAAYGLAHRAPHSLAAQEKLATLEENNAENGVRDITNHLQSTNLGQKVDGVDDMRKTNPNTLKQIHNTLKNNSRYRNKKQTKQQSNMRTIQETFDETDESLLLRTPRAALFRPIVTTASAVINRLQNVPSSDEFAEKRVSRLKKRGIVFTGFNKEEEQILRRIAEAVELKIQTNIDNNTRCVLSFKGQRTLTTLKAIILGVPIVKPGWLHICEQEDKLISVKKYVYPQWENKLRPKKSSIFERLGRILVIDGCSPPSDEIRWMIRKCGGHITDVANESDLIVSPANKVVEVPWTRTNRHPPPIVPEKYILDCITENKILIISDYSEVSVSIVDE